MLLDNGVDLHSFQPTADDMVTISGCDLFIYTGGESDAWVEDALSHATNPDLVAVNLMDLLGDQVKAEETVEGMQETAHLHSHEDEPMMSTQMSMMSTSILKSVPMRMTTNTSGCL